MQQVDVASLDPTRFDAVLDSAQATEFAATLKLAAEALDGRTFWHLNSTSAGGGVAEMLQSVLSYLRGGGVSTRWGVIDGDDDFFVTTKRLHHFLHGSAGDGGDLGHSERAGLMSTLSRQMGELESLVHAGDVVVLHDPQTVGFAPLLRDLGAGVIWTCHIGTDQPNEFSRRGWDFLSPYADAADKVVFSRATYAWDVLDPGAVEIIPPCIDAFSPKNQFLQPETVAAILSRAGVIPADVTAPAAFERQDGTTASVESRAQMIEEEPLRPGARIVTQVSRWDPLKDHVGVMEGFSRHIPEEPETHLVLAGPSPESVTDDPEGGQTLEALQAAWKDLPASSRRRVHIACLPMSDLEENAAIVNALQRRSQVIVQKSLAEGFGLTVAEAMWKEVPTLATAVGGLQDQIDDGVSGILIDDADDLAAFGRGLQRLLNEPDGARDIGRAAHVSVRDRYLAPCFLTRYLELALSVH